MATAIEQIAKMSADHHRSTADLYITQTNALGDVLWKVIHELGLKPNVSGDLAADDAILFGMWRESDVIAAARRVHTYKGEGLTTCGLEVVGPCPDCATGSTANGERT